MTKTLHNKGNYVVPVFEWKFCLHLQSEVITPWSLHIVHICCLGIKWYARRIVTEWWSLNKASLFLRDRGLGNMWKVCAGRTGVVMSLLSFLESRLITLKGDQIKHKVVIQMSWHCMFCQVKASSVSLAYGQWSIRIPASDLIYLPTPLGSILFYGFPIFSLVFACCPIQSTTSM
jgi:hypothetical protein